MRRIREQQSVIFKREDEDHKISNSNPNQIQESSAKYIKNLEEQKQAQNQEEAEEEECEDDDEYEEEYKEPITHCIHRLPFKGQRVNLDLFYDVVEVLKTPESLAKKRQSSISIVEPLKKIGFL